MAAANCRLAVGALHGRARDRAIDARYSDAEGHESERKNQRAFIDKYRAGCCVGTSWRRDVCLRASGKEVTGNRIASPGIWSAATGRRFPFANQSADKS